MKRFIAIITKASGLSRQGPCSASTRFYKTFDLIRNAVFQYDPEPIEVQTAIMAVGSALWISRLGYHPYANGLLLYHLLTRLLPDWAWSLTFASLGIVQTLSMLKNNVTWRMTSAMLSFLAWSYVSALLISSVTPGPATIIFPIIGLSEAWVYLRLTVRSNVAPPEPGAGYGA